MQTLCIESFIIYILCSYLYPIENFTLYHFTYMIIGISLLSFEIISNHPKILLAIGIIILCLSLENPSLLIYAPALSYPYLYKKKYLLPALFLLFYLVTTESLFQVETLFFLFLEGISIYLSYQNRRKLDLESMIKKLRDNSTEQKMALQKQNQQLIESQNDALYIATLQERNRIAREIHDNVGHMLSRSILQLGALLTICKDETITPHLLTLKNSLDEAMMNIRNSVHDLHDEAVQLDKAIQNLLDEFCFCPVKFSYNTSSQIPKNVKYCFLAIIKEALNNVIKHSNATKVTLSLKEHSGFYQLIITDNGNKFPKGTNLQGKDGIGLSSMKERVTANHGVIHITTDHGFRIFITIPK